MSSTSRQILDSFLPLLLKLEHTSFYQNYTTLKTQLYSEWCDFEDDDFKYASNDCDQIVKFGNEVKILWLPHKFVDFLKLIVEKPKLSYHQYAKDIFYLKRALKTCK